MHFPTTTIPTPLGQSSLPAASSSSSTLLPLQTAEQWKASAPTETFTVLPVSLPVLRLSHLRWRDELVLLNDGMNGAVESTLHFYVTNIAGCCWSYHSPLIVGTEIYIAKEGRVVKIGVIARAKSS